EEKSNIIPQAEKFTLNNLEKLSLVSLGKNNAEAREVLQSSLKLVMNLRKKEKISAELFKQIVITATELDLYLDKMQNFHTDSIDRSVEERKLYLEYFNIQKKFNGLIKSQKTKGILSNSLSIELQENLYQDLIKENKISAENKEYLVQ